MTTRTVEEIADAIRQAQAIRSRWGVVANCRVRPRLQNTDDHIERLWSRANMRVGRLMVELDEARRRDTQVEFERLKAQELADEITRRQTGFYLNALKICFPE